jgi:hypothetical protein
MNEETVQPERAASREEEGRDHGFYRKGFRDGQAKVREAECKSWLEGHISACKSCQTKPLWCKIATDKEAELAELEKARAIIK